MKEKAVRLLRWSEKYTKTDMVYLTKGGFWLTLSHAIQLVSGIILAVAFANLLSKESYGIYQFVMSGAAILSVFTLSGMGSALSRSVAEGNTGALPYAFRTHMLWNIGIVTGSFCMATYYYVNDNTQLATAFLIVGLLVPFVESFSLYRPYLLGGKHFKESAILGFWRRPFPLIALVVTLIFTKNPITLVFVYFAANLLIAGYIYFLVRKRYPENKPPEKDFLGFAKRLSLLEVITRVAVHSDKILVFHLLGAAPVAVYTLAQLPVKQLQNIIQVAFPVAFPKFVTSKMSTLQETLPRKLLLVFLFAVSVISIYVVCAPFFFGILFPLYPEATLYSQVLALLILTAPRTILGQVFLAHKQTNKLFIVRIFNIVVRLILLYVLIMLYGLWGAVFAAVITALASTLLTYLLFRYDNA